MTIKNAISMIRNLRDCEVQAVEIFSKGPPDYSLPPDRISRSMAEISQAKAERLAKVLSELQEVRQQRLPKRCKHPKEDHAITADGQRYCMNCNSDL